MTSSSGETGKNNMRTLLCFADGYNNSSAQNVYDTYRVRMRMSGAGWDMIWKSSGTNSTITETIATNTTDNNFIFARDYTSFMNKNVGSLHAIKMYIYIYIYIYVSISFRPV